jgi:hypothetical protein
MEKPTNVVSFAPVCAMSEASQTSVCRDAPPPVFDVKGSFVRSGDVVLGEAFSKGGNTGIVLRMDARFCAAKHVLLGAAAHGNAIFRHAI